MASVDNRKGKTLVKLSRRGNDPTPGDRESRREHGKQRLDKDKEGAMVDPEVDQDQGVDQAGEESNSESDNGMFVTNETDFEVMKQVIAAVDREEKINKQDEQRRRMERIKELTRTYAQSQNPRSEVDKNDDKLDYWKGFEKWSKERSKKEDMQRCEWYDLPPLWHGWVQGGGPFVGKHPQHRVQNR